ncbi:hypothetical protein HZP98_11270 [Elizabethkingia anophelis]|nr:hypothetical protein [Elizabethkingia anophelis]MCT3952599.1 hypothetical protein [Elizabethkingia anophelis]MCT3956155.1 hypothetical protein [Elizabethkingia anophelis]MCT3987832.1 hypothetical protein [Elizabethkingia anophelis]MCT4066282.1 hypothetical protein [Elizabethkingia anophelis]
MKESDRNIPNGLVLGVIGILVVMIIVYLIMALFFSDVLTSVSEAK